MNITKDRKNNNKILGDSLCPLSFSLSLSLHIYYIYERNKMKGKKTTRFTASWTVQTIQ